MSDNTALIAEIEANLQSVRRSRANGQLPSDSRLQLLSRAVTALSRAERELTELGTAFRDYKIVHPEGTHDDR